MSSEHEVCSVDGSMSTCPFCNKSGFKKLGNHLPRCKERNGQDYSSFLAKKTLAKKARLGSCKSQFCSKCHKRFSRLDTHLRNSAICKTLSVPPISSPPRSSYSSVPSTPSSNTRQPDTSDDVSIHQASIQYGMKPNLCLPTLDNGWKEANEYLARELVPHVINEPLLDDKHAVLVEGVYTYFATQYGTKQ